MEESSPNDAKNRKPVEMNILLQAISHYKIFSVTLRIILVWEVTKLWWRMVVLIFCLIAKGQKKETGYGEELTWSHFLGRWAQLYTNQM